MQLKQLKLAGFKSFVDPTIIPVNSQLTAVVGPNGCGKSNIIDAVRWVMGESLAKNLRGEALTDVIFKGSTTRKPVGQASVELVFDNRLGRLTGEYASYQEISIKRIVTLDGDSQFYLNGIRCRRRDVVDLFLGTGAGARGYAIIGQDTISRLIEAHPDDLRSYLEEAAGVAKYKERRRETVLRMQHTQDNLARVADIREELAKQLARLERQAVTAQNYIDLKQAERLCRAGILALKQQEVTKELTVAVNAQTELAQACASQQTHSNEAWRSLELTRTELAETQANHQTRQSHFYTLATEIALLQENLHQQAREQERLQREEAQALQDIATGQTQLEIQADALRHAQTELNTLHAEWPQVQQKYAAQQMLIETAEAQEREWQLNWEQHVAHVYEALQAVKLNELQLCHAEERYQQVQVHIERTQIELSGFDHARVEEQYNIQQVHVKTYEQALTQTKIELQTHERRIEALHTELRDVEQELHHLHEQRQQRSIEKATLMAAQQAVFAPWPADFLPVSWQEWPRTAQMLHVPAAWLPVCEYVFHECLLGLVCPDASHIWSHLPELHGQAVTVLTGATISANTLPYPRLSDICTGIIPQWSTMFTDILAANDLEEALTWLPKIPSHLSILTPQGYWLGHGWARVLPLTKPDESGLLTREQRLSEVTAMLSMLEEQYATHVTLRNALQTQLDKAHLEVRLIQQRLSEENEQWRDAQMVMQELSMSRQQLTQQYTQLIEQQLRLEQELETYAAEQLHYKTQAEMARVTYAALQDKQQQMQSHKLHWETPLATARATITVLADELHQVELKRERTHARFSQHEQRMQELSLRLEQWKSKLQQVQEQLIRPVQDYQAELADKIARHTELQANISQCQQDIAALQQVIQQREVEAKQADKEIKRLTELLQQNKLQQQASTLHQHNLQEMQKELGLTPSEYTQITLPDDVVLGEAELVRLDEKIKRLGAINLLAIEEYQADRTRKEHLDKQHQDLIEALAMLNKAITKLDKETEQRLRETFDQVNASFQQLFPRLFGGGLATLTLTSDSMLEAGIVVMAQPPGKRNSTIHMLSGGEKALTAVALVFAIFQLNPSPFCMLDEVDAPLDDTNVRRFCELVKEMAVVVQFLFITHNKITMELAEQLVGVTMREPGVSRIVTVDVETLV